MNPVDSNSQDTVAPLRPDFVDEVMELHCPSRNEEIHEEADPATKERHIKALGQAMVQKYAARGIDPNRLELIYWLHDAEAMDNADAIQRWVRRMLANAPSTMDFEDKVLFIERGLSDMLERAYS